MGTITLAKKQNIPGNNNNKLITKKHNGNQYQTIHGNNNNNNTHINREIKNNSNIKKYMATTRLLNTYIEKRKTKSTHTWQQQQ